MNSRTLHTRFALFLCAFLFGNIGLSWGQATVFYEQRVAHYNAGTIFTSNTAGAFNQGSYQLGMYANSAATPKQVVAWRKFMTAGDNSGSERALKVGDEFKITLSANTVVGQMGFALLASPTNRGSWNNRIENSLVSVKLENYGFWYATYSNGTNENASTSAGSSNLGGAAYYKDFTFTCQLTAPNRMNITITDGATTTYLYDVLLNSSNPITEYSIFLEDDWNGQSHQNIYWNTNANSSTDYVKNLGSISMGSSNGSFTIAEVISNGMESNSTSIGSVNSLTKLGSGTITFTNANTYTGLTSINAGTLQLNKSGGGTLPSTNSITVNSGGTLRISSNQTLAALTINSGGTLLIDSGVELTVTGTLTNNGTMTIENGATFKQGSSVTGSGTYNIKQTLSDNAGSGNTLTGRYWYMGTPVPCARSVGFGNAGDLNKVWSFSNGAYAAVADATNLSPTTGYVHRRSDNGTLTFSGANLYAQDETLSLSNNAGTYAGWHLVANPYTAYLDWAQVHSNSTNISPTYYIRSYNSSGPDLSALIAYNASTGLESNTSSYSLGATGSTTAQYIAPLQAIWVKVNVTNPLSSSAGQLNFQRAFTSHQSGNVGLKNSTYFPILARVNLVDDARFDQALIYMNQDMSNAVDANDSEKMFVSGAPQIYTMAAGKKLVMNGLKNNKKKISVPLYLDVPTSKNYELHLTEYVLDYGKILLEDKQEGILTDFTINDTYAFYASSGLVQGRFVLHFYPSYYGVEAQGPSNEFDPTDNSYAEGGEIVVTTDSKGKIQVILDQPRNTTIEGTVRVSDASGRVVHSDQLQGSITEFELDVPSGIYYLTVQYGNILEKKKVFIQE